MWETAPGDRDPMLMSSRSFIFPWEVHVVRWSPEGEWLASGGADGQAIVWCRSAAKSLDAEPILATEKNRTHEKSDEKTF